MKKFLINSIIFALPFIALYAPVYTFLRLTGENYYSIEKVIESNDAYLIGYAYNAANTGYLKWKSLNTIDKKDIWALGSSRVLQFREEMFEVPFYNSGYTVKSISDFLPFLGSIPKEKYPEVIIIGLDQWMFNKNWDNFSRKKVEDYWQNSFSYSPSPSTISSIIKDFYRGKYGFSIARERLAKDKPIKKIGLQALVNNEGIRNDGSRLYGNQIDKLLSGDSLANDFNYSDTYQRIDNGNRRFEYGKQINLSALSELDELLQFCHNQEIFVVGFIPPFANDVLEKMRDTGEYGYLESIYPTTKALFDQQGFELWDLEDLRLYGSSDDETLDGFHGGELTHLKMLIYMVENQSTLNNFVNTEKLKEAVVNAKNRYSVF